MKNLPSRCRAVNSNKTVRTPAGFRTRVTLTLLAAFTCAFSGSLLAQDGAPIRDLPTASEVIAKALEWGDWQKEQPYIKTLTGNYENISENLDRHGEVKSREEVFHRMESFDGRAFYRRLRVNGRPLTAKERQEEQKRKNKFVEDVKRDSVRSDYNRSEGSRNIRFDRDLISRYRSKLVGREELNGRMAYLIEFEPKSNKLPIKSRIDHALNKSRGRLWIDTEDYGVARVEFRLIKPVSFFFWLGKLTRADGELQMSRVDEGYWLPQNLKIYYNGRILFHVLHRRAEMKWSDFVPPSQASGE